MKQLIAVVIAVVFTISLYAAERHLKASPRVRGPLKVPATHKAQDEGDGDTNGGGSYAYCVALRNQGQKCRDVVMIYTSPGTLCATGCNVCASVSFSASCSCNRDTLALTGKCTYW